MPVICVRPQAASNQFAKRGRAPAVELAGSLRVFAATDAGSAHLYGNCACLLGVLGGDAGLQLYVWSGG